MKRLTLTALSVILLICAFSSMVILTPNAVMAAPGPEVNGSILVNGVTREYKYSINTAPAPAGGRPVVIHLHGDGGDMGLSPAWKSAVLNDTNGAVLLSARGRNNYPAAPDNGSAWDFRMDKAGVPYDDIDFINALIDKLVAGALINGANVNASQIYVVGESRGGGFAYYLYADPRTRNKVRAIVPISGTFFCDGDAQNSGTPGTRPVAGSDVACGEISPYGYWQPKLTLFSAAGGVTRAAHILAIHGSNDLPETAPPQLDVDYSGAAQWWGWAEANGCYSTRVSAQTEQTLPRTIGGYTVKTYKFSQSEFALSTRCNLLDLEFYVAQGAGHVPAGFEATAWCYLSTIGGAPSTTACPTSNTSTATPTPTMTPTPNPDDTFVYAPIVGR